MPALHDEHVSDDEAPTTSEYFPLSQLMHARCFVAPETEEYCPAAQSVQVEAPVKEYPPARQSTHAAELLAAGSAEKKPALHGSQIGAVCSPRT